MSPLETIINEMRQQQLSDQLIRQRLLQQIDQALSSSSQSSISEVSSSDLNQSQETLAQAERSNHEPSSLTDYSTTTSPKIIPVWITFLHYILLIMFLYALWFSLFYSSYLISGYQEAGYVGLIMVLLQATSPVAITGTVYWGLYLKFVDEFKKNPRIRFAKEWSYRALIMILCSPVLTMFALIGDPSSGGIKRGVYFCYVIFCCMLVIFNYFLINFVRFDSKLRKRFVETGYIKSFRVSLAVCLLLAVALAYLIR